MRRKLGHTARENSTFHWIDTHALFVRVCISSSERFAVRELLFSPGPAVRRQDEVAFYFNAAFGITVSKPDFGIEN